MCAMSVRSRMMAIYSNELPDRIPVSIYSRYLARGYYERELRNMGLGIIEYYPVVSLLAPPWHTCAGFLSEVKGADFSIKYYRENNELVEIRVFETKVGVISQHTRKDPVYGSDWITKYYISQPEDYEVMQYIVENTVFCSNEKQFRKKSQDLSEDGVVLGRLDRCPFQKLLVELAGPEKWLMDICTDFKPAKELLEVMEYRSEEYFELVYESSAEVIWQPENVSGDLTSPNLFKKYCMPFYEKFGSRFRDLGKPYLLHLDGRLKSLKDLIADSCFDGVESFSYPEMGGDISFQEARKAWPGKIILPNFPSSFCDDSDSKIESFLNKMLSEAGTDKPFMLQISEDIPHNQSERVLQILCRFMNIHGEVEGGS